MTNPAEKALAHEESGSTSIPSDEEVFAAAQTFRNALNAIDRVHWDRIYIDRFPKGACGHCAELLAFYLQRRFGITADYVCKDFYKASGEHETGHAWLEWNGLVIDISGDQFGWPPVIVTRHSELHAQGETHVRYPFSLDPVWWGQQCAGVWAAAQHYLEDCPAR